MCFLKDVHTEFPCRVLAVQELALVTFTLQPVPAGVKGVATLPGRGRLFKEEQNNLVF